MHLTCIPCEVYHREFDAKLLVACSLVSTHQHSVLLGWDKHFNNLLPNLPPVTLLDKACSAIEFHGRFRPCKSRGGFVIVNDEEGIQNLGWRPSTLLHRFYPDACEAVDLIACWGQADHEFYSSAFPEYAHKMAIFGNPRSELLTHSGRQYYSALISSLKSLYGDFILCSDNFANRHRNGAPFIPTLSGLPDESQKLHDDVVGKIAESNQRGEFFASVLKDLASSLPHQLFIVRPHPASDERWWHEHFWSYRNVIVTYAHSIEPWIHAAKSFISMGCTGGIQAALAGAHSVELLQPGADAVPHMTNLSLNLAAHKADSASTLAAAIREISQTHVERSQISHTFSNFWANLDDGKSASAFASLINSYSSHIAPLPASSQQELLDLLGHYSQWTKQTDVFSQYPNYDTKWIDWECSDISIERRVQSWSSIFRLSNIRVEKVARSLWLLGPAQVG